MDQATIASVLVALHVLSAIGFVAAHGVSMVVAFRLGSARDVDGARRLLDLSARALGPMYLFPLVLLLSGIASGIVGGWWTSGRLWIWASLAMLIAIAVYMTYRGNAWFSELRGAAGQPHNVRGKDSQAGDPDPARLQTLLAARARAWELLAVGGGGLALLVYLMISKPF